MTTEYSPYCRKKFRQAKATVQNSNIVLFTYSSVCMCFVLLSIALDEEVLQHDEQSALMKAIAVNMLNSSDPIQKEQDIQSLQCFLFQSFNVSNAANRCADFHSWPKQGRVGCPYSLVCRTGLLTCTTCCLDHHCCPVVVIIASLTIMMHVSHQSVLC